MPLPPLPLDLTTVRELTTEQWKAVLAAPPQDAFRWVDRAARLGHAGARTLLGQWLLDGRGCDRDAVQAFDWFLKAAAQGDEMGANMAGRCLENGWGTARDPAAAVGWYRKAADRGLDAGLYNLANQSAPGGGLPLDDARALGLYTRAAALGHAKSMTKAGRYHEEGLSVHPMRSGRRTSTGVGRKAAISGAGTTMRGCWPGGARPHRRCNGWRKCRRPLRWVSWKRSAACWRGPRMRGSRRSGGGCWKGPLPLAAPMPLPVPLPTRRARAAGGSWPRPQPGRGR